ncbi:MAG TPA: hypothetical protein VHI93_07400 [Candidatus Thermoplasmatota archaeon]|nr:hypothetical protein [Candidatus Thermoplasmatota archaeon]
MRPRLCTMPRCTSTAHSSAPRANAASAASHGKPSSPPSPGPAAAPGWTTAQNGSGKGCPASKVKAWMVAVPSVLLPGEVAVPGAWNVLPRGT